MVSKGRSTFITSRCRTNFKGSLLLYRRAQSRELLDHTIDELMLSSVSPEQEPWVHREHRRNGAFGTVIPVRKGSDVKVYPHVSLHMWGTGGTAVSREDYKLRIKCELLCCYHNVII